MLTLALLAPRHRMDSYLFFHSSSRVSPIKTRLFAFCMRRGRMFF